MRHCYCTNPDNCTACRPAPEPPRTPEPLKTPDWWRPKEVVTPYIPQNIGWVCPKCNKALAPWVSSCDCNSYNNRSYNIIFGLTYYPDCVTVTVDSKKERK